MKYSIITVLVLVTVVAGCGRVYGPVKEVEAFSNALDPFLDEMTKTIAADKTEAGVDKAAKLYESKKADLKAKRDAINAAPQGFNSDWQGVYFRVLQRANQQLDGIESSLYASDAALAKFKTLHKDIETTLKLR